MFKENKVIWKYTGLSQQMESDSFTTFLYLKLKLVTLHGKDFLKWGWTIILKYNNLPYQSK